MEALPSSFGLHGVEINAEVFELLLIYKFSQTARFSSDPAIAALKILWKSIDV